MSSVGFKKKHNKSRYRNRHKTIDEVHDEKMKEFVDNTNNIVDTKMRLQDLEDELKELNKINNAPDDIIDKRTDIRNEINKIKNKIDNTESFRDELHYLSLVDKTLAKYYDSTHGKIYGIEIEDNNYEGIQIDQDLMDLNNIKGRKMKKKSRNEKAQAINSGPIKGGIVDLLGVGKTEEDKTDTINRALCEKTYLKLVDKEYMGNIIADIPVAECPECGGIQEIDYSQSMSVCTDCGYMEDVTIQSEVPSNRENYAEKTKYPYQRPGHFREKLNLFLCKNNVKIPKKVYDAVRARMCTYSYTKDAISMAFIKKALKEANLSTQYEYSMYIYCKIKNIEPLTITKSEYDILMDWFMKFEEAYMKHFKPKGRKNFLRYPVVLHRLFLKMGKVEHAANLTLLKNPKKMAKHTKTINEIFKHLGWTNDKPTKTKRRRRRRKKKTKANI